MPITPSTYHRSRDSILAEMLTGITSAIPDFYVGEDGTLVIVFTVAAGQFENVYLANQLLLEDVFIQTASSEALRMHGEQYGVPMKLGTPSLGTLRFEGAGGTYVPIGAEAGYDPGGGLDVIFFTTTVDGTIPNTGVPSAPVAAVSGTNGNLNGSYEYTVTYVTAEGETLASTESAAVNPANKRVDLSAIPVGGPGVIARRIYREKNGSGVVRRVIEIADNTTTTYQDNIDDATVAANPAVPTDDTAHRITLAATAQQPGIEGNVSVGVISELTSAPSTLTGVYNPTAFTGGSDPEDTEDYRARLLARTQNPQTGSPNDLKEWSEEISGVETATVFPNDNLGTPQNGHVTVRLSGVGGSVPSAEIVQEVYDALIAQDMANIIIHVATFNPVPTNVTVDVTLATGLVLADVTPSVQQAVADYINSLAVGETLRVAGIVDAVFGLSGILDVVVTTPSSNQTTAASDKRTPGTTTVV